MKTTLPPWIRYPGSVDTEESRNCVPPPGGAGGVNLRAVHLAEVKRTKENKGYVLHFLEETEEADHDAQVGLDEGAQRENEDSQLSKKNKAYVGPT